MVGSSSCNPPLFILCRGAEVTDLTPPLGPRRALSDVRGLFGLSSILLHSLVVEDNAFDLTVRIESHKWKRDG